MARNLNYCVTVTNGTWEQPILIVAASRKEAFRKAEVLMAGFTAQSAFVIG